MTPLEREVGKIEALVGEKAAVAMLDAIIRWDPDKEDGLVFDGSVMKPADVFLNDRKLMYTLKKTHLKIARDRLKLLAEDIERWYGPRRDIK